MEKSIFESAIETAIAAGQAIMAIYARDFDVELKADKSPLTEADRAAHNIIIDALCTTGYPVLSEESGAIPYDQRRAWTTYWLVDPLDGTKEFIKKNDEFTVNIALIDRGSPVFGVVYAPVLQTLYVGSVMAGKEHKAWRSGNCAEKTVDEIIASAEPLSVSGLTNPELECDRPLRVVASRTHCNEETDTFISALEEEFGEVERVSSGSSLKLCMVAEGSADIYPRIAPTMEWDTAAAHAVVTAAGGAVYIYEAQLPVSSYHVVPVGESSDPVTAPFPLRYNKENLLNPHFVVSGLRT